MNLSLASITIGMPKAKPQSCAEGSIVLSRWRKVSQMRVTIGKAPIDMIKDDNKILNELSDDEV